MSKRLCSRKRPRTLRTVIVLAHARNARAHRADAARHDLDPRPRLRRLVERLDDRRVGERVDLDPDPGVLLGLGRLRDRPDLLDHTLAQVVRRGEQLAQLLRMPEAGQVVEEVGDVRADVGVGREEAEVLVEPRRRGVVVAGADVGVAAQASSPSRRTTSVVFAWIFRFGKP